MDHQKTFSAIEVSQMLHVSKNTVYELIRRGELNHFNVGRKIRFTQEDVNHYIARSRHEKQVSPVRSVPIQNALMHPSPMQGTEFILSGQDVILDILSNYLRQYGFPSLRAYVGSFESLLSLYQDEVQIASSHLWDGDGDVYNLPYVRRLVPGTSAFLVNLSYRMQGFYVQKNNPKRILDWTDLTRPDVRFLNRRKGSGSRILLDEKLRCHNIDPGQINGYDMEIGSHRTAAAAIAHNEADAALGTERITRLIEQLDFVPLQEERYDLVIKSSDYHTPEVQCLLQILNSPDFRAELEGISGNDYRDLGKIVGEV